MSMNPSCDSCGEEDAEHVLCEHCMQESAAADAGSERQGIVALVRDFARRLSVQSGVRSHAGADAAYLIAEAIETGKHLDVEPAEKESTDR